MIETRDGARIPLHTIGTGPQIVVAHGGGVTIEAYQRLARRLADRFTVHLYNRRGRGDAPARTLPYEPREDIDDLGAVLEHTGAVDVIGHSGGGFVALHAARRFPIRRLALYDAAVQVDGLFPTAWLDPAREAARTGDTARALALTAAGLNTHQAVNRLPLGVRIAICRLFLRTPIGTMMGELLATTLDDATAIRAYSSTAAQWSGLEAEVLLACGASGPSYYPRINEALAAAIPRARTLLVPRSAHDALNRAHPRIVEPLIAFFGAPGAPDEAPSGG